jgi:hypothetical protein
MIPAAAAYLEGAGLAFLIVVSLGRFGMPLGHSRGNWIGGIAEAVIAIFGSLILAALGLLISLAIAWSSKRRKVAHPARAAFLAAASGLLVVVPLAAYFGGAAAWIAALAPLLLLLIAAALAERFIGPAYGLLPAAALALLVAVVASEVPDANRVASEEAFAHAIEGDDLTAIDRAASKLSAEQIDRFIPSALVMRHEDKAVDHLVAGELHSPCLDALRAISDGGVPSSECDDEAVLLFSATHDRPAAIGAAAERSPTLVASLLENLLQRGDQASAVRLLEGAGRFERAQRLTLASYDPDMFRVLDRYADFARAHTDDDAMLVASAALESYPNLTNVLLERGAHADRAVACGTTPLAAFITRGELKRELLRSLLAHGANPNRPARGYCLPGGRGAAEVIGVPLDHFAWRADQPGAYQEISSGVVADLIQAGADPRRARPETRAAIEKLGEDYAKALH